MSTNFDPGLRTPLSADELRELDDLLDRVRTNLYWCDGAPWKDVQKVTYDARRLVAKAQVVVAS